MLKIEQVDLDSKSDVNEFIKLPHKIYKGCKQWVPLITEDVKTMMNKQKHPFYEHSDGDFFVARKNGEVVGRIAVMINNVFNEYHGTKKAQFYFFDAYNDQDVANALFEKAFEYAKERGMNEIVGPKGLGPFDGYGIQIQGHDIRQMMVMMNYNYPYYSDLVENLGFEKDVDFVSCFIDMDKFNMPEKVHRVAERVIEKGNLEVRKFKSKKELIALAPKIGEAYNKFFVNNWEYYPLSKKELDFAIEDILSIAVPKLIKVIMYEDEVIGFLFGFPDVSDALQRAKGSINPISMVDLLINMNRANLISLNGVGVLDKFHGRGANALMYSEIYKTIKDFGYKYAELTQVANTAVQMRKDLKTLGGIEYKNHRVYKRKI